MGIDVHLVDGTYELFRYHFALPSHRTSKGDREVAATRGVLGTVLMMLEEGATHIAVATDHIIESFRNDLWPGYKTSAGMDPELLQQFPLIEQGLEAAGITVFAMVEHEADDALGAAAAKAAADDRVERVYICTPDKDLGQCVGGKVVQLDRRKRTVLMRDVADALAASVVAGLGPRRCPRAEEYCAQAEPEMREIAPGQFVACHFPLVGTPVEVPTTRADSAPIPAV
jgi:5'-3' exonuclease